MNIIVNVECIRCGVKLSEFFQKFRKCPFCHNIKSLIVFTKGAKDVGQGDRRGLPGSATQV